MVGILTNFKYCCNDTRVCCIWIQEGWATVAVHQFVVLTYYSHCHGSVRVLDRKVFFISLTWAVQSWAVASMLARTKTDGWIKKVPSQNTHAMTMLATRRYLFLTPPNVEREKLLQGACLPCSLWTSVVQQSRHPSILMPTSNCENPSCFRRKSIPCVDRLPFGCIMFFAMKGSYEPENVFVDVFLMANSFCPPCSKKYNIALMVHGHLQNIQVKYIRYILKTSNSNGMYNADILQFFTFGQLEWGYFPKMCKFGPVHFTFKGLSLWYTLVLD